MKRHTPASVRRVTAPLLALLAALGACKDNTGPEPENPLTISLEVVQAGFSSPLFVTAPPGDTHRLFVVERGGLVRVIEDGALLPTPFLDVSADIVSSGEQGLLGLAFHPDYATNGYVYVDYTDASGDTQVMRYVVTGDPNVVDATPGEPILSVDQPYTNHNGGMLAFGPDGMLYVGLGDGGSGGDPDGNGQNRATLLGSILRLDVDGGLPYSIPADNPFAGHATYREEIWAYGLRNPWRFSFDRQTGDLLIGDVGQGKVEEVDFQPASSHGGENYGWNVMEGSQCYGTAVCSTAGLVLPVAEYGHSAGCSITGGYVYRGTAWPALQGRYFYGDYCSGWIRSFQLDDGTATDLQDHSADVEAGLSLSSFGEDGAGELYVVDLDGTVYRLTGTAATP